MTKKTEVEAAADEYTRRYSSNNIHIIFKLYSFRSFHLLFIVLFVLLFVFMKMLRGLFLLPGHHN